MYFTFQPFDRYEDFKVIFHEQLDVFCYATWLNVYLKTSIETFVIISVYEKKIGTWRKATRESSNLATDLYSGQHSFLANPHSITEHNATIRPIWKKSERKRRPLINVDLAPGREQVSATWRKINLRAVINQVKTESFLKFMARPDNVHSHNVFTFVRVSPTSALPSANSKSN